MGAALDMNYLSYRFLLSKLHRKRDKEEAVFRMKLKEASRTGKHEEVRLKEILPLELCDEEISILMTQRLKSNADKLLICLPDKPVPEKGDVIIENETWRRSDCFGEWYLKSKAIMDWSRLIKKEWREVVIFWSALIFGIIGLITGLIALIKK